MLPACSANLAPKSDLYTCPALTNANGQLTLATSISLFSGHPSELARLKPDNADTDDKGPQFWTTGASQYDYWYQCIYESGQRDFKLPKIYARCTNFGAGKIGDKLKCE